MRLAFVSPSTTVSSSFHSHRLLKCERKRLPCRTKRSYCSPSMMAKFQQQEQDQESPEGESALEDILPKPVLPTLSTLSGEPTAPPPELELQEIEPDDPQIATMGASLSADEEESIKGFFVGVVDEFKLIDWPSASRVARLTVLIVVTIIIAVVVLYFVDGFFYRLSTLLFEGNAY